MVGGGSFFASSNCSGSLVTSAVSSTTISFRPALANGRPLVGEWALSGAVNGVPTVATLMLGAELRAPPTRLQVGVCTPLEPPVFTGLMTAVPVSYWTDIVISSFTLPSMFSFCGGSTVTIHPSSSPTVPSLLANRVFPGSYQMSGSETNSSGLGLSLTYQLTACMADGGTVSSSSECCGSSTTLSDGGLACP